LLIEPWALKGQLLPNLRGEFDCQSYLQSFHFSCLWMVRMGR
jgi:hypothetical protein